jgi:TsgA-like MFS transporter
MRFATLCTVNTAKIPATAVAIATYVIASGIFTQGGVVLEPAAAKFHASLADTAVLFSYASAGNLAGMIVSTGVVAFVSLRRILACAYACVFAGIALIVGTSHLVFAYGAMFLIGLGVGTGLASGAVILAKLYVERARAAAFLSTDCAFSGTGFVIPAVAAAAVSAHWIWQTGYVIVAGVALLVLLAALTIALPPTGRARTSTVAAEPRSPRAFVTIALFAGGIACYIIGQTTFTIWAPAVLHDVFGAAALQSGGIVSAFFGPSSLGLVTAAIVVSRVPPRAVLAFALVMGAALSFILASISSVGAFVLVTFAFGFTTTCMYKLMISIGSEQLAGSPPPLVTTLLLCSGIGTTLAPLISAAVVKGEGLHASLWVAFAFHAATLVIVFAALANEALARRASRRRANGAPAFVA